MSDQPDASGQPGYSAPAKWLHWLIAPIVLAIIPVGAIMGDLPRGALQDRLFFLRRESFGLTVLALIIARIARRLRGAPPPAPSLTPAERMISAATHHAMYLLLALTPVLGWLALSAYGLRPAFFGLFEPPALLAKDEPLSKLLFFVHGAAGFSPRGADRAASPRRRAPRLRQARPACLADAAGAGLVVKIRRLEPCFQALSEDDVEVGNAHISERVSLRVRIRLSFGRVETVRMIFHFRHSMKVTGERWRKLLQKSRPQAASPWGDRRGSCQRISRNPADRNASSCTEASRK